MTPCKLEVRNLTKAYPGVLALNDFSATFDGGKVYALLGKNGSGKSTLVKCLSGAVAPTSGEILIDGAPKSFSGPADANAAGIACVYQELSLILDFTVAENMLLGSYSKRGPGNIAIEWGQTNARAAEILQSLKIDIPVTKKVSELSVGQRQVIEIAKAMAHKPRVLILDEPTSALARHEINSLMEVVRESRAHGVIVIFITHKLNEIRNIADHVTVLRDSKFIGTVDIDEATPKIIVEMMFGETTLQTRPLDLRIDKEHVRLKVANLSRKGKFADISFEVRAGEILGIAGMLGAGRSELLRSIFGADPVENGKVTLNGTDVLKPSIQRMKRLGLGMTMENRKEEGLIQVMSVEDNLCLASLARIARHGLLSHALQAPVADKYIRELQIKVSDPLIDIKALSGGNQQKVLVGNWLNNDPSVMFFDEPTRGIDIQAKQQIFRIMWELSRRGLSVVFVSSELEELLEVCHRILIMENGRLVDEVTAPETESIEGLYARCMGERVN